MIGSDASERATATRKVPTAGTPPHALAYLRDSEAGNQLKICKRAKKPIAPWNIFSPKRPKKTCRWEMIDESMMRSPLPPWTKRQSSGWFPREIARTGSAGSASDETWWLRMVPLIYETYGNFIFGCLVFCVFPKISHIFHGIGPTSCSFFVCLQHILGWVWLLYVFVCKNDKKYQWGHPIGPTLLIGYPLTNLQSGLRCLYRILSTISTELFIYPL